MKQFTFIIFFITVIFSFLGCNEIKPQQKDSKIQETDHTPTVFEYNPKRARAKIVQRIDAPAGIYVTYTNKHYYLISIDKIVIFDIHKGKIQIIREIPYQIEQLIPDVEYDFLRSIGCYHLGDKVFFGLYTKSRILHREERLWPTALRKSQTSFQGILSLKDDGTQLCYADITDDLSISLPIKAMYFDKGKKLFYTSVSKTYKDHVFEVYHYDDQADSFKKQNEWTIKYYEDANFYITNKFVMLEIYHLFRRATIVSNAMVIYRLGETNSMKTILLSSLGLRYSPLSAFSDKAGNIWLYVREYDSETQQDKYELLKLKLLE